MKKKAEKKIVGSDGFILDYEKIRKAVNSFDKEFGIKLKDPEIWCEPDTYRTIIVERAKINLAAELCLVNGIVLSDYFNLNNLGDGLPIKPIGTMNPSFVEDSMLNWDKLNNKYNTNSLLFRARFVSNVVENCMVNFGKIISNSTRKCKNSESENQIVNVKHFMDYIIRFCDVMLDSSVSHQNIILKMHEITSYKYKKVNQYKLKNEMVNLIRFTRKNMHSSLIEERFYTDDMCINELLKISYILATNDTDYKVLPGFKYIEGATVKHDLIKLIEELGKQIIKHNGVKKYPIMFLSYIKANPSILTQYSVECHDNLAIATGIMALSYTQFVMDDKEIDKFVKEMFRKGI